MRMVNAPDEMIVYFDINKVYPVRFRWRNKVYRIERVLQQYNSGTGGWKCVIFRCQGIVDGQEKLFELEYYTQEMRWRLHKI